MDKGIGFSRTVLLDWLDVCASLCQENLETAEIRNRLAVTIADTVHGKDAQRKTIDVLTAIWLKTAKTAPQLHRQALDLFPTLSSRVERTWLHYGMTLVCYPIFRKCSVSIGQISRIDDSITRKTIKERIAAEVGHLGALDRSVERILASLTNWGMLAASDQKHIWNIQLHSFSSPSAKLQTWLLACALHAHPADSLPFNDLIHLPELYPFRISVGVDQLRQDSNFEIQLQGGDLTMVKVNS